MRGVRSTAKLGAVLLVLLLVGLAVGRALAPGRTAQLVAALADPAERGAAYRALHEEVGPAAIPALLELALDRAAPMHARGEAVELLGRIGGRHADRRPLAPLLALDEPALALRRLEALGRLGGEEALVEVLEALRGAEVPPKFPALRVLTEPEFRDVETARLLADVAPFLDHEQAGLREFAVKFMGVRRHGAAEPALVAKLRDPDASVRHMAAWSLTQLGTPDAIAAVQSAIESGAVNPEGL